MILYHGSHSPIERPDVVFSRDNVDFGRGFYATPIREQAQNWARRFVRANGQGVLSLYELDDLAMRTAVRVCEFPAYSEDWLDFIASCRKGENTGDFDVVIGDVANDKVFNTLQLFFDGLIDKNEAIKRLRFEKPDCQYCFRSQRAIETFLQYKEMELVR